MWNCSIASENKTRVKFLVPAAPLLNVVIVYVTVEVYLIQDMRLMFSILLDFDDRIIYIELAKPGAMPSEDAQEPLLYQRCGICRSTT